MDRTFVGDLEQFGTLLTFELAGHRDLPLDPSEDACPNFGVCSMGKPCPLDHVP